MELHKSIKIENTYNISINDDYLTYFGKAKQFVDDNYKETLDLISNTKFENVSSEFFYREYVWCVCASGFNSKVVSRFFPKLMTALNSAFDWIDNKDTSLDVAKSEALLIFGNERKIEAMMECARILRKGINIKTWSIYRNEELNTPDKLSRLPFIGQITKFHISRNLGLLNYMKPDRHLTRIASHWGFNNPVELCEKIQDKYDIPIGIIDLVLFYSLASFGSK